MKHTTTQSEQAAQWLKQGKLLAYPTESVWGIGCDAYNEQAVNQILAIKNRPREKGMIVVTDSVRRIEPLLSLLPKDKQQHILDSWHAQSALDTNDVHQVSNTLPPSKKEDLRQAHTWLLPIPDASETSDASTSVPFPTWITGSHHSVAVRVIAHPLIAELCQHMVSTTNPYGLVVSTSCNPSGETPASTFEQAYHYFGDDIAYLLGDTLSYRLPSQIRDGVTGSIIR